MGLPGQFSLTINSRFYAPSLRALTDDLLPDFPEALLSEARRIAANLPPLPELE